MSGFSRSLNYQVTHGAVTFFHMMLGAIVRLGNRGMVQPKVVLVSCSFCISGLEARWGTSGRRVRRIKSSMTMCEIDWLVGSC